ncbi:MAG: hypothetical protein AAFY71_23040 [Bacteroidota bacterium]
MKSLMLALIFTIAGFTTYGQGMFICKRGYEPPNTSFTLTVNNQSMWKVSFRTKSNGRWSAWTNIKQGKSIKFGFTADMEDYEWQWLDIHKWRSDFKGGSPVMVSGKNSIYVIKGNTFNPIHIDFG